MLISSAFPSKFLKAEDLAGATTPVTMTFVKMEQVAKSGDLKPVLYFKEFTQGMVLNKTNSKAISKLYGDDTNRWKGQKVELFEMMVDFQGDVVPALRIRPLKDSIPWENPTEPVKLSDEAKEKILNKKAKTKLIPGWDPDEQPGEVQF